MKTAASITVGLAAVSAVFLLGGHWLVTGRILPKRIVDDLEAPVRVREVTPDGLVTDDGELLKVRFVERLPERSKVIRAAVANGVEVDGSGRAFGLLEIHHWCGNDPVEYHLARVELAALVLAAGGKPDDSVPGELREMLQSTEKQPLRFGEYGLAPGDWGLVRYTSDLLDLVDDPRFSPAQGR